MAIFKVFKVPEWQEFTENGEFKGSSDDLRDGFIHFSTESQLRGTLDKYYAAEAEIIIALMSDAHWGDQLKWEPSRGGQLFPHLYGTVIRADVTGQWRLKKSASSFDLSGIARDLNLSFAL